MWESWSVSVTFSLNAQFRLRHLVIESMWTNKLRLGNYNLSEYSCGVLLPTFTITTTI